jgi:serine protease Do
MKLLPLVVASVVWGSILAACSPAQPILNRVEQLVRDAVDSAKATPQPAEPGYLGLTADDSQDAGKGVRVLRVVAGQAAAQAGLRTGDLITRIDDRPVRALDDMAAALEGKPAGSKLSFVVVRGENQQQFDVTLGSRAGAAAAEQNPQPAIVPAEKRAEPEPPRLGVRCVPVTDAVRRLNGLSAARGAHVISVAVGSPADRAGIPLGAVINGFAGTPINTPEELAAAVRGAKPGPIELTYVERGQAGSKNVTLISPPAAAPPREVRARPPVAELPGPSDEPPVQVAPPTIENPELERDARIEQLERRVQELEARVKTLEAERAGRQTTPAATPQ